MEDKVIIGVGGESLNAMAEEIEIMMIAIIIARQIKTKINELGWDKKRFASEMGISINVANSLLIGDFKRLSLLTILKLHTIIGINELKLTKQL